MLRTDHCHRGLGQRLARWLATCGLVLPVLANPVEARGPDSIADVAEQVIDAVVNISTSQRPQSRNNTQPPTFNDSPNDGSNNPLNDDLFRDFFDRRGQGGNNQV